MEDLQEKTSEDIRKILCDIESYLRKYNEDSPPIQKSYASRRRLENHGEWIAGKISEIIDSINCY